MQDSLVKSIFSTQAASVNLMSLLLALGVSLGLGIILALVYRYKTFYTKEFILTLALLPTLIALIIFLVNGNLGTGVAVAGTFSLIKFRSAAGSAKELLLVFMATAIGLASGMGYLALASLVTLLLSAVLLAFEYFQLGRVSQTRRLVTLVVGEDFDYEDLYGRLFGKSYHSAQLLSLETKKKTAQLVLTYEVDLESQVTDKTLFDTLRTYDTNIDITINTQAQKRKTL